MASMPQRPSSALLTAADAPLSYRPFDHGGLVDFARPPRVSPGAGRQDPDSMPEMRTGVLPPIR
eukprot:12843025-Prorocentrum_lima.AAC.1